MFYEDCCFYCLECLEERNDQNFRGQTPSLAHWKVRFQSDLALHQYSVKPSFLQDLLDWLIVFSS
jgi:hypothetical protein